MAGYPVAYTKDKEIIELSPDTSLTRNIKLSEEAGYLTYRAGKYYTLYYWDKEWIPVGSKHPVSIKDKELMFEGVPHNCLLLLLPEYTQGKERPFIITEEGSIIWF